MQWIPWDAELELGHAAMDEEHKKLIGLVNQLADRVLERPGPVIYEDLLNELLDHARTHFRMEEQLMAAKGYPFAEEHSRRHAQLIQEAVSFRDKFNTDTQPSVSLLYYFQQWLTQHIATADRDLAQFLASSG